jgi:hypothetical protein
MKCVVLLGFSTTGKSTIIRYFKKNYPDAISTVDTDKQIGEVDPGTTVSEDNEPHIYNVFLRFYDQESGSTARGLREIERREKNLLKTIRLGKKPLLIGAGPFLPARDPEWSGFVGRVHHPMFFYIEKTPEEVLQGLLNRRERHRTQSELVNRPGFGCWDKDVTTEYQNGQWVYVGEDRALQNIRIQMQGIVPHYEKLSDRTFR